ncbi:unnamed protein product [Echinostoma caproni]|uniref:40S ribosomal protein S15 n=1 Tax=Echinostoma caproni TaxID=27848 RepID=A0A183A0R5_9TREM|nr:unnamed protein product [Echinostoma caproni]
MRVSRRGFYNCAAGAANLTSNSQMTSLLTDAHIGGLKQLKSNWNIVVLRPDKGSGAVVMDKSQYKEKMMHILQDQSKCKLNNTPDDPIKLEKKICAELKTLTQTNRIQELLAKCLRQRRTQTTQLYGLPKVHKEGVPLRPM